MKILVACLAGITAMGAVSSTASAAPIRVLYAPSESDDPFYRSGIAAALPPGSVVDYYDARASTPDASLLASYDAVHTWPSLGCQDSVEFGNRLADFVDLGGTVVLGAFSACTWGYSLAGRIMTDTDRYCPVTGGSGDNPGIWDGSCASDVLFSGIREWTVDYVDELTLVQSRGRVCGRFLNGQIAIAVNGDENVFYVNGSGGYPLWAHAATPVIVAHACAYRHSPTTAETVTWGMLRALHW